MLKKTERLDRPTFSKVFSKGKRTHSPYITAVYHLSDVFLCSVVVSKKVSKKAPVRNTIRRRMYSIIENQKIAIKSVGSYIFIVKPEVSKLTKRDFSIIIKEEVGRVLK